ncbi:sortase [Patescibacteria group bacterium]
MKKLKFLNKIANLLIFFGLLILLLTFFPVILKEADWQINKTLKQSYILVDDLEKVEEIKKEEKKKTRLGFKPKILIPQSFDFSLVIPEIGVNSLVFPNIDSGNEKEYLAVLRNGVAHAKNSKLPDQPGVTYIFAHSTDTFYNISHYNAQFFLLRKLEAGVDVLMYYKNKKYHYKVIEKLIIEPEFVDSTVKSLTGNRLVLQTCYPPGTTLKRLLVIAKLQ